MRDITTFQRWAAIGVVLACVLVAAALHYGARPCENPLDWPSWPPGDDYNPNRMATCANRFIAMGEPEAYRRLHVAATAEVGGFPFYLLCLALYGGDSDKPLRGPIAGSVVMADVLTKADSHDCPNLPLLVIDDIPFAVRYTSIVLLGAAETGENYLNYCRANGRFRRKPYRAVTKDEASKAIDAVLQSDWWKKLNNGRQELDPERVLARGSVEGYLRKQVDNIDRSGKVAP